MLPHSFHDTSLFIGYISHPIGLSCRDQKVGAPAFDVAVQGVGFVDAPFGRVVRGAGAAVEEAGGVVGARDGREDVFVGRGGGG